MEYLFLKQPEKLAIEEIITLYRRAGWWAEFQDSHSSVARLVDGSHCFIVARDLGVIVGMGRAISDGVSDAYLQDITVRPDYRGHGVGREIVHRLLKKLEEDGIGWVALIAEGEATNLYQKEGFVKMQNATPMWRDEVHAAETRHNRRP